MRGLRSRRIIPGFCDPRAASQARSVLTVVGLFLGSLLISHFFLSRLGLTAFLTVLIGLLASGFYARISFMNLTVPFIILILSIGGFRFLWSIQAPVLPDLYLDRMMLIWLLMVFMIKSVAEKRSLRGPWALDLAILGHGLYLLVRVYMDGMEYFHTWSMSIMVPYFVYFFSKYIIETREQVRTLLFSLLILSFYYHVTSVAEKFHIEALLWPKYMTTQPTEFIGRSCGPFMNSGIFGFTVGALLPINLYFIHSASRTWQKVLFLLNFALGVAGLYFTYTRGAWLASAACLGAVVLMNRRHYLKIVLPLIVVVPLAATFFLGLGQDKFMKERVENNDTIGARVGAMVTALRVWRGNPILGCGTYRYVEARADYLAPVSVPGLDTIPMTQLRGTPSHDMYFSPLAEDGLVGAFFQIAIFFLIVRMIVKKYKLIQQGDYFATYFLPFFVGILVLYLVAGLAQSFRHVSIMGTILFLSAGVMNGYRHDLDEKTLR